jgi:hypothetical protein
LAEDRQQHIVSKADFFRKQYIDSLAKAAAQQLERELRLKQREHEATLEAEIGKRVAQLDGEENRRRTHIANQITNLGYSEVIYRASLERSIGAAREKNRDEIERVRRQVRNLTLERDAPRPDYRPRAIAELEFRRRELEVALSKFERTISDEKMKEIDKTLSKQRHFLKAELESIPQLAQAMPTPKDLHSLAKSALTETRLTAGSVRLPQSAGLEAQLKAQIAVDTRKAVLQIFDKRGWQWSDSSTKNARDTTAEVAAELQRIWGE